jgi:hypothetical protein
VTKGSETRFPIRPGVFNNFVVNYQGPFGGGGFVEFVSAGTCHNLAELTATTPSCTITAAFQPDVPGPNTGVAFPNDFLPQPIAQLTGIGLLSRKSSFCRKGSRKKVKRYCQK